MSERNPGRKEIKVDVGLLGDVVQEIVSRGNLREMLSYWAGGTTDLGDSFSTRKRDEAVEVVVGSEPENQRTILRIGIGVTSLVFDNRTALEDFMIYKAKPLVEIRTIGDLRNTVQSFLEEKPKREQMIDLGAKTEQKKTFARTEGQEKSQFSVEHLRRKPKPDKK